MRASRLRHLCAAAVFILFLTNVRAADINVSNLSAALGGYSFMNNANIKQANSFTTGAFVSDTSKIESITLSLAGSGYDLSTLSIGIYTNNAGTPSGTQLGANYTASGIGSSGNYTFTNVGSNRAELNPSSTYWLVVRNTTTTTVMWANSNDTGPFNGLNASINQGSMTNPTGIGWNTNSPTFLFSMVGVPEPSTYAMGAVGVMTVAGLARRRKRTA